MDALTAIRTGDAPREVRIAVAKGLFPLKPAEMVEVLHLLSADDDQEIRSATEQSIAGLPDTLLEAALYDEGWPRELLQFYARACNQRTGPLEAVILNPSSADQTILELARSVPVDLMELIVINQVRILREPDILEALLENPALNAFIRGRVNELKFDFFEKKDAPESAAMPADPEMPFPVEVPDLPVEKGIPLDDTEFPEGEPDGAPKRRQTIHEKLTKLDMTGKIRLAKMGSREERMQLVKSPNRLICTAAVRSPKITDSEVESIVQLRNIHEDVLRFVSRRREWTRRYSVVVSLIKNPRTPVGVAMQFLGRLTPMDLRIVGRNRDIPEVIRKASQRLLAKKFSSG